MSAPDRPTPTGGPWTRHGHDIPGVTVAGGHPPAVARCGGPALCRKCREDVELAHGGTSAAPDRPTRGEVDACMGVADDGLDPVARTLAAGVRALRAELEQQQRFTEVWRRGHTETTEGCKAEIRRLRAALAARTPQPAEPTRHLVILSGLADEIDQHAAIAARPGQMGDLERIACAVRDVANELAPLPTVSDGEDETSRAVSRLMFDARPVDHAAEQVAVRTVDLARVLNEFIQYAAAGINKPRQEGP